MQNPLTTMLSFHPRDLLLPRRPLDFDVPPAPADEPRHLLLSHSLTMRTPNGGLTASMVSRPLETILLVDDSTDDNELTTTTLRRAGVTNPIFAVDSGERAMRFLELGVEECDLPCLVLLDIKMPEASGFDVLAWARAKPQLQTLPVVILTSSNDERDQKRASELGASGYLLKMPATESLAAIVRQSIALGAKHLS